MAKPTFVHPVEDGAGDQMHRIRRSEMLLAELYGKKTKTPQYRVRPVRGVHSMLIVSLLTLSAVLTVVYYKVNTFIMMREAAFSRSGNLDAAIQRRANLFSNLIKLTLSHAALEHAVFSHTAEMRTEIVKSSKLPDALAEAITKESNRIGALPPVTPPATPPAPPPAGGKPAEAGHPDWEHILKSLAGEGGAEGSVSRLLAMVEQYPNIQSSETYKQAMSALVEMEDRIAQRRIEYNESLREYNTEVTSFPWRYLANLGSFERIDYDHAANPAMAAKDITPELYQQLLPLVRTMGGPK